MPTSVDAQIYRWGEPRGSFENASVSVCKHISLIVCLGKMRGNFAFGGCVHVVHRSVGVPPVPLGHSQCTVGVHAFRCAEGKLRKFQESVKILRKKSGSSPHHRLVHIQCL